MLVKTIVLKDALHFPGLDKSLATLTSYVYELDDEIPFKFRKSILVCPGGGYSFCSKREAEPIALFFVSRGYNAYVLDYSTTNRSKNRFPVQLLEAMAGLYYIKSHASEDYGNAADVHVIGFSAGGHLAGSLAFMGNEPKYKKLLGIEATYDLKIKSVILGYPVTSAEGPTHLESFQNIVTKDADEKALSLEHHVTKDAPALFVFSTSDDNCVPIRNSLVLSQKYADLGKEFELHIYQKGPHGLSLGNEVVYGPEQAREIDKTVLGWADLAEAFIRRQ